MKIIHTSLLGVACAAALITTPLSAQNLVTNGGFETGDLSGWDIHGFTTSYTGVDTFPPYAGNYTGFFGDANGIDQTLATIEGQRYTVHFAIGATGGVPNDFEAYFDGQQLMAVTDVDWQWYDAPRWMSFDVVASSSSTVLDFDFNNELGFFLLDGVSVTAGVPEPASWALMLGGFGLVGGALRGRRKAAVRFA